MRLLVPVLLLLAGTGTGQAAPTCHSGMPPGFVVDGRLDEWRGVPSFSLGPTSQVAGHETVVSVDDASATAWLALGIEGLAIAVDVRDDVVRSPLAPEDVASDHVEVRVAFAVPRVRLQWYDDVSVADCHDEVRGTETKRAERLLACHEWFRERESRLAELDDEFLAEYVISAAGAIRIGRDPAPGVVASARHEGGHRLEALLPLSMLPRTGEAPLRHVRVVLDLVDADDDEGPVAILSSSPARDLADPSTFELLTVDPPVRYGAWPDWLERVMAKAGTSCRPAADVGVVETWIHHVTDPRDFPPWGPLAVVTLDISRQESLGTLHGVELLRVESAATDIGTETALVSRRDGTIVDFEPSLGEVFEGPGGIEVRAANRGSALHALIFSDGRVTRHGTSAGGGAPEFGLALVTMDARGRLSAQRALVDVESSGEDLSWTSDDALTTVQIWMTDSGKEVLRATITYDPKRGRYDIAEEPSPFR